MKISSAYTANSSNTKPAFKGLHVINPNAQKLLLTELKPQQLKMLSGFIKEQENNSVHILLDSENGKQLNASLICMYRLQNFKTKYKQIPIFESKIHFIKRIAGIANEYKKQIKDLKVLRLQWEYSLLPEWITKICNNTQS